MHGVPDHDRLAGQFVAERLIWIADAAPRLYATVRAISQKTGISLPPSEDASESVTLAGECQSFMIRNSDRQWPSWSILQSRIQDVCSLLPDAAPHMLPALAAPLLAARYAAHGLPSNSELSRSVREARRFDQTYFDRVYPLGILHFARDPRN